MSWISLFHNRSSARAGNTVSSRDTWWRKVGGRKGEEAGFHSFGDTKCSLIEGQNAGQGTKGLKATDTMKVADHAVCVCTGCYSLRHSQWVAVFPSWLYTGSSQHGSKELTIAHSHVLGSFGMSPQVSSALQSCCTDYSSNHRRKAWCVAVRSISNLSV